MIYVSLLLLLLLFVFVIVIVAIVVVAVVAVVAVFAVFVKLINLLLLEISVQSELVSRQFWMAAAMPSGRKLIAQTRAEKDLSVK
jgi:hypothetical protein